MLSVSAQRIEEEALGGGVVAVFVAAVGGQANCSSWPGRQ